MRWPEAIFALQRCEVLWQGSDLFSPLPLFHLSFFENPGCFTSGFISWLSLFLPNIFKLHGEKRHRGGLLRGCPTRGASPAFPRPARDETGNSEQHAAHHQRNTGPLQSVSPVQRKSSILKIRVFSVQGRA